MNEFMKFEKEVRESNGYIAQQRLIYFKNVYHIYDRNFKILDQMLEAFSDPEIMLRIWDVDKRADLDFALIELVTYLHNYLAGFITLVDHSRIMMNRSYSDQSIIHEYQKRISSEFVNDPLACFINNLRNYMLHYSLPSTFSEFHITQDPKSGKEIIQTRATIKKDGLLYWSGWSRKAVEFLDKSDDDIELLEVIRAHEKKVRNFNEWLIEELNNLHSDDFIKLRKDLFKLRTL